MSIVLNNGSTVVAKRRERPKLLFDESGKPRCSPVRVITVVTLSHRMKLRRDLRGKKNNYFVP